MSGQYKVRSNSQDDFSDINTAYNVAKTGGGCWENIKSCLGLIFLLAICGFIASLMTGNASAQSTNNCFPHETLYTAQPIEMKRSDSRFSATRGKTRAFQVYRVLEAKKDTLFSSCWVRISGGWMLRRPTGSAIRPGKPAQRTTTTTTPTSTTTSSNTTSSTASSKCYTGSKAYITGSMNIRSGPSVSNGKVGIANAGESYTVSNSQRNGDYCWLKISKGWMAKTGRVQSTKPTVSRTSTTCAIPPVYGSDELKRTVQRAYGILGRHSSWCNYVSSARPSSFSQLTYGGCAQLDSSERQFKIYLSQRLCRSSDGYVTASFIVHEACHLHQLNAGSRLTNLRQVEPPCYQKQIDFLTDVAPGRYGSVIRDSQSQIRRYGG